MHLKHPEILWALLLLLIPIIVHLFRLRRFKKELFTNVRFLREVNLQTRKSSTLKKWLVLAARLLGLTMLVLAFAQPYLGDPETNRQDATYVVYLDNSYSMQMPTQQGSLLENAMNRILTSWPSEIPLKIITNDGELGPASKADLRYQLLAVKHSDKQLDLNEIMLKAAASFDPSGKNNALYIVSDLQENMRPDETLPSIAAETRVVRMKSPETMNIAIDSLAISGSGPESISLEVFLSISGSDQEESTPVSVFSGNELMARSTAVFREASAKVDFILPKDELGLNHVEISDPGLKYDNRFFFNLPANQKVKVMHIGEDPAEYLGRIFTDDEFILTSTSPAAVDYSTLASQNLVILDELKYLPDALSQSLSDLAGNGLKILQIPSLQEDKESFSTLNRALGLPLRDSIVQISTVVNTILYDHPLIRDVFNDRVQNFRYPSISAYFSLTGPSRNVLEIAGKIPFLYGNDGHYAFTAPLNEEYTDFKSSALIVPVLYNIGLQSLKQPKPYFIVPDDKEANIQTQLGPDQIVSLEGDAGVFIPRQQNFGNYVRIYLDEEFTDPGHYRILRGQEEINQLSINASRKESNLEFINPGTLEQLIFYDTLEDGLDKIKIENKVNELWKWFVIFALVFFLTEMLILKYFK